MTEPGDPVDRFSGRPRVDENGVDPDQVDDFMRLTPAERLRRIEEFANFILTVRRSQGLSDNVPDWTGQDIP